MKKSISLLAIFALALLAISHPVSSAAKKPVPGATCTKLKATQVFKGKKYTCIKSGKKLVWNKGVSDADAYSISNKSWIHNGSSTSQ